MSAPVKAVAVGLGHRTVVYSSYAQQHPDELQIVAAADPNDQRLRQFGERFGIASRHLFRDAESLAAAAPPADAAINGTMDADHVATSLPLLAAGYHLLLEKPIARSARELRQLADCAETHRRIVMICHVLRYAPFYAAIRERVAAGALGQILSINSSEHVSYHHMAIGFIRGRWRRRDESNPILLAKCCHDLDVIAWMKSGVPPLRVASAGALTYFRSDRAPAGAGKRCLVDCGIEADCAYSARKHYIDQGRWGFYAWEPIEHIAEPTIDDKLASLRGDSPFGRCVWHCDNDVVDHQAVIIDFADGAVATHTLAGTASRPCRRLHLIGTEGEIEGVLEDGSFVERHPDARAGHEYREARIDLNVSNDMHGGGDLRLVSDFVRVLRGEQPSLSTTTLADSLNGHLAAYAADLAMLQARVVPLSELP